MKDKIISLSFVLVLAIVAIFNILLEDNKTSLTEKRKLASFPEITLETIKNRKAMEDFEKYTLDQFPFRDEFRTVKANIQFNALQKLDNNNIFVKDDQIFKMEYPLNEKSINDFTKKINSIYDKYLQGMNVYYSIVPDKNYYLKDDNHLKLDYNKLFSIVNTNIKNMQYIDITKSLSLNSYYLTDTHWRQEKLQGTVNKLAGSMNFKVSDIAELQRKTYFPFYGVYYGQAALNGESDRLTYLTNDTIQNATVYNIEDEKFNEVYNIDKLGKMDSYDVFLSGATPFMTIENSKNTSGRELVIFRDSFGSSITPLLIESYSKITLIDLRYMNSASFDGLIQFKNQDILFLYSTIIINNSGSIRD